MGINKITETTMGFGTPSGGTERFFNSLMPVSKPTIVQRYNWMSEKRDEGVVVLYSDHLAIDRDRLELIEAYSKDLSAANAEITRLSGLLAEKEREIELRWKHTVCDMKKIDQLESKIRRLKKLNAEECCEEHKKALQSENARLSGLLKEAREGIQEITEELEYSACCQSPIEIAVMLRQVIKKIGEV